MDFPPELHDFLDHLHHGVVEVHNETGHRPNDVFVGTEIVEKLRLLVTPELRTHPKFKLLMHHWGTAHGCDIWSYR